MCATTLNLLFTVGFINVHKVSLNVNIKNFDNNTGYDGLMTHSTLFFGAARRPQDTLRANTMFILQS